jgi:hypothetical protein
MIFYGSSRVVASANRPGLAVRAAPSFLPPQRLVGAAASRIVLRHSVTLQVLLAAWLFITAAAVYTGVSPWLGARAAWALSVAFTATGILAAMAWQRRQPRVIELDTQGASTQTLAIFAHDGTCVAHGRLVGCAQWGGWLLVLAIAVDEGRRHRTVLVAADALTRAAFRELAVRGRIAGCRSA